MNRREIIQHIRNNPKVSVLILGGGVNGIGVFRDLGLQGIDVLLVERADYCSGTSAASSRMVHGGLRYLENREFQLVRESVQERNWLLEFAPHAVQPQPSAIPFFHWFSGLLNAPLKFLSLLNRPAERGAIITKIGLYIYDAFTGTRGTIPRHKFLQRADARQQFPGINPKLLGIAIYYDAQMALAERICVEMILDTEKLCSKAHALNYVSLTGCQDNGIVLLDTLSGEKLFVQPKILINATGPWIDDVNNSLGQPTNYIGGTKGSHIVINNSCLYNALNEYLLFFENSDGRYVMMCRLGECVLVGSTDIYCSQPDEAICTPEEEDYFLKMIQHIFPDITVKPEEIVFRFSGVRPLPTAKAKLTGQITRNHRIETIKPTSQRIYPILNLVGGKWTTFRSFAEQVTNKTLDFLNLKRVVDSRTGSLGGGKDYPKSQQEINQWLTNLGRQTGVSEEILKTWFTRYGTRAAEFALFASGQVSDNPLQSLPEYSQAEIIFILRNEKVVHLDDFLLRRSLIAMEGKITNELIRELSKIFQTELGWDETGRMDEINRLFDLLEKKHNFTIDK